MTNKNPYENGVDIPDFVEKKDDDIDMSVFKLADDDAKDNSYEYDDEDYDDEPRRKLSSKGVVVILGVVVALLFIAAIAGWIFGISKNSALTKATAENQTLQTKLNESNTTITSLENQITVLNVEIEKYKSAGETGSGDATEEGTKYKMEGDVSVRKAPGSSDFANFNNLPDAVADQLYNNEELKTLTTRDGAILPVYETKTVSGNTWGRIAENAWVCLVYQGETWGTKQ